MAISYVGGKTAGRTNASAALAVDLTTGLTGGSGGAPLAGDFVLVTTSVGTAARAPTLDVVTPTGYTPLTVQRTTASTYDSNVCACHKVMGSTPDADVTVPGSGNNADGLAYAIQVFRGVDPTNPLDVAAVYAVATGVSNLPNPAAITPATAGAWIVACGGGAAAAGGTYAAGTLTNFLTSNGADTNDGNVGAGYYTGWTSGAYDPAAFTGGSTNAANSWAAITIALRPAPEAVNGDATGGLSSSGLTAPDSAATGGASAAGDLSTITATAPTATATGSAEASGAVGVMTLTAPAGSASGVTAVDASASGGLAGVALNAANATATGGAGVTATPAAITQTAPTGSATGAASATGSPATITLTAPAGSAAGTISATASGALAAIGLTAPNSTATASATASGSLQSISLTAPSGTASGEAVANGNASGLLSVISLTAATAQAVADAQAVAVFAALQINPATGAAYGSGNASGSIAAITLDAPTGSAASVFASYQVAHVPAENFQAFAQQRNYLAWVPLQSYTARVPAEPNTPG